jgi:hypothetical protein
MRIVFDMPRIRDGIPGPGRDRTQGDKATWRVIRRCTLAIEMRELTRVMWESDAPTCPATRDDTGSPQRPAPDR